MTRPNSRRRLGFLALGAALLLGGCESTQGLAIPVGSRHAPRSPDAKILIFKDALPTRHYEVVAKLTAHIEKTFFLESAFNELKPQLEKLARDNGADALISIEETKSHRLETYGYTVNATAIVFTD